LELQNNYFSCNEILACIYNINLASNTRP